MKKISILLFFIATTLLLTKNVFTQDGPNSWTLNLNNNARVYAIAVDFTNPNNVYCGGLDSGVYKSTNAGQTWFPINSGMTYFKVQTLAIAPSNGNILYAGTDQNGASNSGVYVSTNAGASWTLMNNGITDTKAIQQVVINPTNPNIAYISVFDGANAATVGVFKTTDGGNNWAPANNGMTNKNILALAINPLNPNVVYAGSSLILPGSLGPSTMYRSNDGGANWVSISNGLPTGTTTGDPIRALSISTSDTAVVLAGLFENDTAGGVYVSTNSGQLWVKKYAVPNLAGTLFRAVMIRPGTSNQFYVGIDGGAATSRGVRSSIDGGATWTDFNSAPMSNTYTVRAVVFGVKCDTTLYCGAATATPPGRGIYNYTWPNNPSTCNLAWTSQTSGTTQLLQAVSTVNNLIGWAGGNAAAVRRTTNGGLTWSDGNPNPGVINGAIYNMFAIDANICLLTTSPAATFIYRTSNGGTNWTQVFTQAGGFIDGIEFVDANTGFAYGDPVGARWSLWKTTNGGVNWDSSGLYLPQNGSEAGWNNAINIIGSNIWFGTSGTRVYYSTNFGSTWSFGATGDANSYSLAFNYSTHAMVGGGVLNQTTNGGANYTTITAPGTGNFTSMGGTGINYWYTRGNNIYATANNGVNWTTAFTGTAALWAMDVKLTPSCCPAGWAVGAGGTILRMGVISGISSNNNNEVPLDYKLTQNYPNPFNPTTTISFQIPKAGNVKLVVFDILGREVKTLVNEFKQVGNYKIEFNANNFASGVYFYRLDAGSFTETKKMLLVK